MIAEVIPYTRTIRGKDVFDYAIPEEMHIEPGMIVQISFRSQIHFGLVYTVKKESPHKKLLSIQEILPYFQWQDPRRRALLTWFANLYALSLPHAFKTLQYPLLKRPKAPRDIVQRPQIVKNTIRIPQSASRSIQAAVATMVNQPYTLLHYSHRIDCIVAYRGILQNAAGSVLIIVPEYYEAYLLAQRLSITNTIIIPEHASPSFMNTVEMQLKNAYEQKKNLLIIATKKGIMLPLQYVHTLIIDQEESRSHKQFTLNPRYHIREIAHTVTTLYASSLRIVLTSHAPSIDEYVFVHTHHKKLIDIRRSWKPVFHSIDMNDERKKKNYSWFSEELIQYIKKSKRSLILFNRAGKYRMSLCKDCSTLLSAESLTCSDCKGVDIIPLGKGTQTIERELQQFFPGKKILRVDRDQDVEKITIEAIRNADIVVATEKIFRIVPLEQFHFIGLLSIDHVLVYPHFRAHERVFQFLTAVFASGVPTILQTNAPEHRVIQAAIQNDYTSFAASEIHTRQLLKLPPYGEYIQLIDTKQHTRTIVRSIEKHSLPSHVIIDRE